MITFRTTIALALALITPIAAVPAGRSEAIFRSATYASCFAICEHPSHGEYRWLGPLRTGVHGADRAANDAAAHNNSNPGHTASAGCN